MVPPMSLFLNAIIGSAAGLGLAWTAREPLERAHYPSRTRYFTVTVLYAGAALVPVGLILFAMFPDWSLMYTANPAQLSWVVMIPGVVLLCFGAPILGFFVAQRLIASNRSELVPRVLGGLAVVALALVVLGASALGKVGYYEAYHYGGAMLPLASSPVLVVVVAAVSVLLILFVYTQRAVRAHIRALADVEEGRPVKAGGDARP